MNEPLLFLSHAGEEEASARELARLLDRAGVPVWLDVEQLRPGDRWMDELQDALRGATAFAVYVGRSGVARWVGQEVRVALDRSVAEEGFAVIPILGPGADPEELPVFLAQHQWVDLRDGLDDARGLRELTEVVLGEDRRGERLRRSLLPPDRAPFLGLRPFGEEDAFLFYGRDREVEELLAALGADPFLAVVGASGCGKSSLVRAGLLPALRRGRPPGPGASGSGSGRSSGSPLASWRIAVFRPADDPFRELAAALPDLDPELSPTERMEVGERISGAEYGIGRAVAALVPAGTRTLLVVDQLEEVFTQTGDADARRRFLDVLLAAGRPGGDRPVHVLATLRADFYSRCWEHPDLPRRIAANQYPVERMARDQLREVVEKPLALAGVTPEAGLTDELLDDAGDEPGNLPLLEHALFQLWDQPASRRFTHEAYREMGGLAGALEHHAEAVFEGFDSEERGLVRRLLLCLVVLGEAGAVTRRRTPKGDLLAVCGEEEAERARAVAILDRLVGQRLLTASGGGREPGEERVEVAHEALLRSWGRLREWLEEDREFLLWRQRLTDAVAAWERSERSDGELLRGGPLRRAEDWLERRRDDLTPAERDLIEASLALEEVERERRVAQARRLAAAVGGVALLLLVTLVGAVWLYQREERRNRLLQARGLAARVETVSETRPQLGTLLGLHALRLAEGAGEPRLLEAETALRTALAHLGGRVVGDPAERILDGAVVEDAVLLATTDRGDEGGPLRLRRVPLPLPDDWRIASGEATVVMEDRPSQVVLAPSGRWLAASAENRPLHLWWVQGREAQARSVALHDEEGRPLDVTPASIGLETGGDEERLIVEGVDGQVRTWPLPSEDLGRPPVVDSIGSSPPGAEITGPSASACDDLEVAWRGDVLQNPWRSPRDRERRGYSGHDRPPDGCALGPSVLGRRLLTWTADEPARLWQPDSPPALTQGPEPRLVLDVAGAESAWGGPRVEIAPGGKWLTSLQPRSALVWDLRSGSYPRRVSCGEDSDLSGFAFSADGERLVLQEVRSTALCSVDLDRGEVRPLHVAAAVQPESQVLAGPALSWFLFFDDFGSVVPADPDCQEEIEALRGHLETPVLTAVSPEGGWFASADPSGLLYLGAVDSGERCNAFRHVMSWDFEGRGVKALAVREGLLAAGWADGDLMLWKLDGSLGEPRVLSGHDSWVSNVAFSSDGRWLASADEGNRLLLWDLAGSADSVRIEIAEDVRALGFRDEPSELLVAHELEPGSRGQLHAFTLDLDRLRTLACRAAGRNLSPSEARSFLGEEEPPPVCPGLPRGVD